MLLKSLSLTVGGADGVTDARNVRVWGFQLVTWAWTPDFGSLLSVHREPAHMFSFHTRGFRFLRAVAARGTHAEIVVMGSEWRNVV